jgi:DNA modification methylase
VKNKLLVGDVRQSLSLIASESVNTCVTSPPYFGLRDYGHEGQLGLEATPDEYVKALVSVMREVKRVLRDDGTLWLNLGDSYAGSGKGAWDIPDDEKKRRGVKESYRPNKNPVVERHTQHTVERGCGVDRKFGLKPKDLIGIPWRVALALQADGWYLRQDIIWHKPNPIPESVKDR